MKHDHILDKIFLDELTALLGYKTRISVKNWCLKNDIAIYGYGHNKHIFEYDYKNVMIKPQIANFKKKYGENWEKAFDLAQKNELHKLDETKQPESIHNNIRYKPKSKAASKLLKK